MGSPVAFYGGYAGRKVRSVMHRHDLCSGFRLWWIRSQVFVVVSINIVLVIPALQGRISNRPTRTERSHLVPFGSQIRDSAVL